MYTELAWLLLIFLVTKSFDKRESGSLAEKMVVLQRIKKPKNKRSLRALEAREPKAIGRTGRNIVA